MKLTKTERMIIQNLMNAEDYLSSYDIASKTGISRRMFRTVIPEIRKIVESYGIELKSISNKGYKMIADVHQKENLLHLMEEGEKSFSHIPEKELELISFDNSPCSTVTFPSIIAIDRNPEQLADKACEILLSLVSGKNVEKKIL
ncbi:MAG: HTH domain-containing protein [Solobacterium sp.]|nr:HTH domain-containing protein [Solobacterium sp.]